MIASAALIGSLGRTQRFGLIQVGWQTLASTPKASARWYARVIASGGRER